MSGPVRSFPGGLCDRCRHVRRVDSPRASYLRCGLSDGDPSYPRYPRLPVLDCAGFEPRTGARGSAVLDREPGGR